MARFALVNLEGKVVNIICWDRKGNWDPPKGLIAIHAEKAQIGDIYDQETRKFKKAEDD